MQQQKLFRYFNLPQSWSKHIENPETISIFFFVIGLCTSSMRDFQLSSPMKREFKQIIILSMKCLSEYAMVKISQFSSLDAKKSFIETYV